MRPVPQRPLLQRNTSRGYIGGVCAGLADYAAIDVTWVRAIFVFAALFGGDNYRALPILLYLVLWVAAPKRPVAEAPASGVRFLTLALLAASVALLLLASDGRISGGLVAAPIAVGLAAALIRPDRLEAKALLVAIGLAASATLFVLNYAPTFGHQVERPQSMQDLRATRPYTSAFGDLTIDLSEFEAISGQITVPVVAHFSDVTLIVPQDRNLTIEKNGEAVFVQSAVSTTQVNSNLTINVHLGGSFNSLSVERWPPSLLSPP